MLDLLEETMKLSKGLRTATDTEWHRRAAVIKAAKQAAEESPAPDDTGQGDDTGPEPAKPEIIPTVPQRPASMALVQALDAVAKTDPSEEARLKDTAQNGDRVQQLADGTRILGDIATHEAREMVTLLYALWQFGSEVQSERHARHVLDCMLTPIAELRRLLFTEDELRNT